MFRSKTDLKLGKIISHNKKCIPYCLHENDFSRANVETEIVNNNLNN